MILEVCANSFQSALAAQEAGAHRIELCSELALGGITPSQGLIEKVVQELEIPVFVLIRPRSGDFTFSDTEFDVMLRDIALAKAQNLSGIVSGILHKDGRIDGERTAALVAASQGMSFTFHRGFDWTPNAEEALETLVALGVNRVLTSGHQKTALEGLQEIEYLQKIAGDKLTILPGGGIRPNQIAFFKKAGCKEMHASASVKYAGVNRSIPMHNITTIENGEITYSDSYKIKELLVATQA